MSIYSRSSLWVGMKLTYVLASQSFLSHTILKPQHHSVVLHFHLFDSVKFLLCVFRYFEGFALFLFHQYSALFGSFTIPLWQGSCQIILMALKNSSQDGNLLISLVISLLYILFGPVLVLSSNSNLLVFLTDSFWHLQVENL